MNKELIIRRFAKASASYEEEATVQRQIAVKMASLLTSRINPGYCRKILEIGCGTGIFSRILIDRLKPERMLLNDICPEMHEQVKDIVNDHILFKSGDAETYPFFGKYNLITSCSAIQWFKDPEAFFLRMHQLLTAEGILAFSTFGNDNIREVYSLTGQGLSYLSPEELRNKLSDRYSLLHVSEEKIRKRFRNPKDVLYHLKRTGVTGIRQQQWTREGLMRFCDQYRMLYSDQEEVTLTYHPIYIIAQKKND
ncbi:MAG: malonyl-ACP O-methyltransferase BioC [Tannerella sp.]|jgi:malonyl-ACP O-methyltransferase BioC|nr:malonyl-ACP O-methyltransferase BioC [Tannerella sp.]